MSEAPTGTGIGQPLRRREDRRLVAGQGCYSDDVHFAGQVYAVMLRSPHAHARIRAIDTAVARAAPGVLAVLTGHDLAADGLQPIPHTPFSTHPAEIVLRNQDGSPAFVAQHWPLPRDKARFAGEAVAMVVATTVAAARDGAERIAVDYEPLPAVTSAAAALAPDAPLVCDAAGSNLCIDAVVGDQERTAVAFGGAAQVVRLATLVQRVTGVPMEPRAAVAIYDATSSRYTLHTGGGSPERVKQDLAGVLAVPAERVRVLMRDVGGNYGTRGGFFPELALVAWAARRLGRPVKWTCERHECFLSDYQGRDLAFEAELALDADGRFLALRGTDTSNIGAHTVSFATLQKSVEVMTGIYHVPTACFRARAVLTNTVPTRPYRATGRPEAMFVMERLIDLAAQQTGLDRVELRRRNLITEDALPYRNPFGMTFDNGCYHRSMETALVLGDWARFPDRRREARRRGRRRGIGVANYVDTGTGVTRERAEVTVWPDGTVDLVIGTMSNGQGHETSFGQLVSEWLGVSPGNVRLVTGDTDVVAFGGGSHSGRSLRLGSIVMHKACEQIIRRGTVLAEHLLEAPAGDIVFADGRFQVQGTNLSITLAEVAAAALAPGRVPEPLRGPLAATCDQRVEQAAFPYGCHVCEVEIEPETGAIELIHYAAVDDVGRAVNPMIVHGQTHGGIAQGVGQALLEHCRHDPDSGQPLAGSFMDYAMPRAEGLPAFATEISEVPATSHPLGIRPGGEGGTVPALAAVVNAVVDALAELGVRHLDMPVTSERVWRAIRDGAAGAPR